MSGFLGDAIPEVFDELEALSHSQLKEG